MLFICMALIDDEEDKKSFAELYNKYETTAISIALKILKIGKQPRTLVPKLF